IVGDLYPEGGAKRDAGFSIFYMGINVGAVVGQLICAYLGEKIDWHLGFLASAIGMTFGVIQYWYGRVHLEDAGHLKSEAAEPGMLASARKNFSIAVGALVVMLIGFVFYVQASETFSIVNFAQGTGFVLLAIAILYFLAIIVFACKNSEERKR
ncbi:MAG: MFS transporter, partial [Calditrichaeota bacterium]|nr:MFS transporter [Calditrichota bacterium]